MPADHKRSIVVVIVLFIVLAGVIWAIYHFKTPVKPTMTEAEKQAVIDATTAPKVTTEANLTPQQKAALDKLSAPEAKAIKPVPVKPPSQSVLDSLSAPQ